MTMLIYKIIVFKQTKPWPEYLSRDPSDGYVMYYGFVGIPKLDDKYAIYLQSSERTYYL
jgi:hypothetical protein